MSIIRREKSHFTSISRSLLQDETLSFEARGLISYLLSHPDDWECRASDIERSGKIGEDRRRRIMREAEVAGYLTFSKERNARGQFVSCYTVHETPVDEPERTSKRDSDEPDGDSPHPDQPRPDNPHVDEPRMAGRGDIKKSEVPKSDLKKSERERDRPPAVSDVEKILDDLTEIVKRQTRAGQVIDSESKVIVIVGKLYSDGVLPEDLLEFEKEKPYQKLSFYLTDFSDWRLLRNNGQGGAGNAQPNNSPAGCNICLASPLRQPGWVYTDERQLSRIECVCNRRRK